MWNATRKCLWGKLFRGLLHLNRNYPCKVTGCGKIGNGFCYKSVWVGVRWTVFYTFVVVFAAVVVAVALYLLPKVLRLPYVTPTTSEPTPAAAPQSFEEKSYFCDSVIVSCVVVTARCLDLLQQWGVDSGLP